MSQELDQAVAFAVAFIRTADRKRLGQSNALPVAIEQLRAALDAVTESARCECSHTHYHHQDPAGGPCLTHGCPCNQFKEGE